jgi:hypothetical protein
LFIVASCVPHFLEQICELLEALRAHRGHALFEERLHVLRRLRHHVQSGLRDAGVHHASILRVPRLLDQAACFEPVEEAGQVRIVVHHPLRDPAARKSRGSRAPEDAQDVELRARQLRRLERLRDPARRHLGRPQDLDVDLVVERLERLPLLLFLEEVTFHAHEDSRCEDYRQ